MIETEMMLNKLCLCVMCKFLRVVVLTTLRVGNGSRTRNADLFFFNIALTKVKCTQSCLTVCGI